jgi:isoleucyl-tRNA synthetase
VLNPVDGRGCASSRARRIFAGQNVEEANATIVELLRERGALLHDERRTSTAIRTAGATRRR